MDISAVHLTIKNIAQMEEKDFKIKADNLISNFIECIEYMNSLSYDEFRDLYYEIFNIISSSEQRFTCIFICSYIKIDNAAKNIKYFENNIDQEPTGHIEDGTKLYKEVASHHNGQLRFANFNTATFPDITKRAYLDILEMVNASIKNRNPYRESADLVTNLALLSIARVGGIKFDELCVVYAQFLSYIELLAEVGEHQAARDALEELFLASKHDHIYYCGLIAKFALAIKQNRNFEALFILILAYAEIKKVGTVHKHFLYTFKISIAQLLRNLQFYDLAKNIFKEILAVLELEDYNSQQAWNSLFACRVSEKDNTVIQEVENYLHTNIEKILAFANNSSRPWIALLCAIKEIFNYDSVSLTKFLEIFDRTMSPEDRTSFYDLIGFGNDIKKSLTININNIYKSRRSNDISAQMKSIEPIIRKAKKAGLENNNADLLLISTFAQTIHLATQTLDTNDGTITIKASDEKSEHTPAEIFCDKFYAVSKNIDILLINSYENIIFCATFTENKANVHKNICSVESLNLWVSNNLGQLGFEESRKKNGRIEGFELYWQEESERIQKALPEFILKSASIQGECLILSDVETLKFPVNLIRDESGYISQKHPVSIVLPSLFHRDRYLHSTTPSINLYAPAPKNRDLTVDMGLSALENELTSYLSKEATRASNDLQNSDDSSNPNIAIFIGHGSREGDRFKGISFGDDGLLLPFEFARLCLSEIVILFVCHAGFSSNMVFNIDSFSIAKELISRGARHVIAPAWPLNVKLTCPWIKTFISQIESGKTVSESCFLANAELREKFKIESAWAAMHHYQG